MAGWTGVGWGGGGSTPGGPAWQAARTTAASTAARAGRRPIAVACGSGVAADAMVDAEDILRVDPLLDREQARGVDAPERALPVGLQVVRLVDVSARAGTRLADQPHRLADLRRRRLAQVHVRLVIRHPGTHAGLLRRHDDQARRVDHYRSDS